MNLKHYAKRLLAVLLAAALTVGMLSLDAFVAAADSSTPEVDFIACSDYQNSSLEGEEYEEYAESKKTAVQSIVSTMKEDGVSPELAVLAGDYVDGGVYADGTTDFSTEEIQGEISNLKSILGSLNSGMEFKAIQGNHDPKALIGNPLDATGAYEYDEYILYLINEDDFPWWQGGYSSYSDTSVCKSAVETTSAKLGAYLNGLIEIEDKRPVFIVTHVPMHWSQRSTNSTDWWVDNIYANILFDVVNTAGENLDIVFLFGHNHSTSPTSEAYDQYIGGTLAYIEKGGTMKVPNGTNGTANYTTEENINFTYMNAGYLGKMDGKYDPAVNTISAFAVEDATITIQRYSADGVEATYEITRINAVDTKTAEARDEANDITVTLTVEKTDGSKYSLVVSNATVENTDDSIQQIKAWDITLTADGGEVTDTDLKATVKLPVPEGYANPKVYYVDEGTDTLTDMDATVTDGYATFKTTHFSIYAVADVEAEPETNGEWVQVTTASTGSEVWKYTNSIQSGEQYVIGGIISSDNGAVSVTDASSSRVNNVLLSDDKEGLDVIVAEGTDGLSYISSTLSEKAIWTIESAAEDGSYYIKYSESEYLKVSGSGTEIGDKDGANIFQFVRNSDYCQLVTSENSKDKYLYRATDNHQFWRVTSSGNYAPVYLFAKTTAEATEDLYARLCGVMSQTYHTADGINENAVLGKLYVQTSGTGDEADIDEENIPVTSDMVEWDQGFNGSVAGTYNGTVTYEGEEIGTVTVIISATEIGTIELLSTTGTVTIGASQSAKTGATIEVTYTDGIIAIKDITVGMLTNADGSEVATRPDGTYTGLTVTYGGKVVEGEFTLIVTPKAGNNYPEYPNPGSVRVSKSADGTETLFQETGVARVDLSVTGLPMGKGVDVVVVLDASSSMDEERVEALTDALNAMLTSFKTSNADGTIPDVQLAVTFFNGYTVRHHENASEDEDYYINNQSNYINTKRIYDSNESTVSGARDGIYGEVVEDESAVMTGDGTLTGSGFVAVEELESFVYSKDSSSRKITLNGAGASGTNVYETSSGTNYDKGLLDAYTLLSAKQKANDEERDQYVIFMSDGIPYQYNGVVGYYVATEYDNWLLGNYQETDNLPATIYNDDLYSQPSVLGSGQPHWTAEAIKGSGEQKVVGVGTENNAVLDPVTGLEATIYSIGLLLDNSDNPVLLFGDKTAVMKKIASSEDKFINVTSVDSGDEQLKNAFTSIASDIKKAGTNAVFTDVMGSEFDIQLANVSIGTEGSSSGTFEPTITISKYELYKKSEVGTTIDDVEVTEAMVGTRKPTDPAVLEKVTFNENGTEAYSTKIDGGSTNILTGNKIIAYYFTYDLDTETFTWNIGDITEDEIVLSYYVYLTGTQEGTRDAGSYATNTSAVLTYKNWLGNSAKKDTVSPMLPWESAHVSYAFYLVNENGNIVNSDGTVVNSFANKVPVTQPQLYEVMNLNTVENVTTINLKAAGVLPEGYELYDEDASYTIKISSTSGGSGWEIVSGNSKVQSTYVMGYSRDTSDFSNITPVNDSSYDYTGTIVWFAVKWCVRALPDTVVIDFGLPVNISVLSNDMFGSYGTLKAVGGLAEELEDKVDMASVVSNLGTGFVGDDDASPFETKYGTAEVSGEKVYYELRNTEIDGYDRFAYAVYYNNTNSGDGANIGYYYGTVTVIPATTIYYEDSFITFDGADDESGRVGWVEAETPVTNATQAEDRPGTYSLSGTDANNIYGYDAAYDSMSTFSMGSARKAHVGENTYATASFTFYGTGFDIIGMTSNTTGVLAIKVVDKDGNTEATKLVDTYYGYTYCLCNVTYTWNGSEWVKAVTSAANQNESKSEEELPELPSVNEKVERVEYAWIIATDGEGTSGAANSLYQVPVMKITDLEYGQYTVTLTATYGALLDHTGEEAYDLYIDGVRIYDPANKGVASEDDEDTTIKDAYIKDGEYGPKYLELRNLLIEENAFDVWTDAGDDTETVETTEDGKVTGAVFIDGKSTGVTVAEYTNYGPNNEVYLAAGQSIAFQLDLTEEAVLDRVHLGMKSANETAVTCKIQGLKKDEATGEMNVVRAKEYSLATATDMYYDITEFQKNIIVITNSGNDGAILSLTNLKFIYTEPAEEDEAAEVSLFMTSASVAMTLQVLNAAADSPETEVPEETPVFVPGTFRIKASKESVKVRESVTVNVTTGTDVEALTINGQNIAKYKENRKTGLRTWTATLKAEVAGEWLVEAVAYDAAGTASEPVSTVVAVTEKKSNGILDRLFQLFFGER